MISSDLRLDRVISIYRGENQREFTNLGDWIPKNRIYCEVHPVSHIRGQAMLGAGQPLSRKQLGEMVGLASEQGQQQHFFIPTELLFWKTGYHQVKIVFWVRPGIYTITNRYIDRPLTCPFPSMIFIVENETFHVFAVRPNRRPAPSTPLFHMPIWNVSDNGRVCTGTCKFPDYSRLLNDPEKIMKEWKTIFFNSEFTHDFGPPAYRGMDLSEFWQKLDGQKKFPTTVLKSCRKKLCDIM